LSVSLGFIAPVSPLGGGVLGCAGCVVLGCVVLGVVLRIGVVVSRADGVGGVFCLLS
jgi:hypothetical protein